MEDTRKRKIPRLELWEVAHTKKNGRFSTEKVEALMVASSIEIQKRKERNNGEITEQDINDVFNDIVAKDFKPRGYYDDKYWSGLGVSRGVKFATQTEERRNKEKLDAMETRMSRMGTVMLNWLDFMSKRFPEDDSIQQMRGSLLDEEEGLMGSENDAEKGVGNSSSKAHAQSNEEQINDGTTECYKSSQSVPDIVKSTHGDYHGNKISNNTAASKVSLQVHVPSPNNRESTDGHYQGNKISNSNQAASNINNAHDQGIKFSNSEQPASKISNILDQHKSSNSKQATLQETWTQATCSQDQGNGISYLPRESTTANMMSRRVTAPPLNSSKPAPLDVNIMSLVIKDRVVARGKCVSTNTKREIGGRVLGSEYAGVLVESLVNIECGNNGDEELPRPIYELRTIRDAVGIIIAWPRSHLRRIKSQAQT